MRARNSAVLKTLRLAASGSSWLRASPAFLRSFSSAGPSRTFSSSGSPTDLEAAFQKVCKEDGPKIAASGSNAQKLRAYALYKQATEGDARGDRPSALQMIARAKYDAWAALKGTSKDAAKAAYVEEFGNSAEKAEGETPVSKYQPKGAFLPIEKGQMLPAGTFKGRVALVTGGGTGLGFAMATRLASLGATVAISSRKLDVLEKAAKEIRDATNGGKVLPLAADVREPEALKAVFDAIEKETGGEAPTIVVNNAAGNFISPFERLSPNAFATVVSIVLNGTANVTLEAGKRMIKQGKGGVFLNITTTYASTGSGWVVPSAAAKAGVSAMTKSLAAEWGKYGIRLNGIAPGPIETKGAFSRLDPSGSFKEAMIERSPSKRLGSPEELANLATYCLSPYASWLNGEIIHFDGGETAFLGGEFNALSSVTDEQWDLLESMIRKTNKKGS